MLEEIGDAVFLSALALVEEDRHLDAALVGVRDRLRDGCAGEAVSLNQNRAPGFGQFVRDGISATAVRGKEDFDLAAASIEGEKEREQPGFHPAAFSATNTRPVPT